jgi:hypothetical protein
MSYEILMQPYGHILAPGESDETWLEIQDKEYGSSPLALQLTRAHAWSRMLESREAASISQLAESIGMD